MLPMTMEPSWLSYFPRHHVFTLLWISFPIWVWKENGANVYILVCFILIIFFDYNHLLWLKMSKIFNMLLSSVFHYSFILLRLQNHLFVFSLNLVLFLTRQTSMLFQDQDCLFLLFPSLCTERVPMYNRHLLFIE